MVEGDRRSANRAHRLTAPYFIGGPAIRRLRPLEIEVRPDRDVVRRLLPGAHVTVHADIGQAVAGLRRQQEVVDPDTPVLLPGAGLVVPERVLAGRVGHRT